MNEKFVPLDYVNTLVYDLEKAFWDERGRGCRFRMMHVGRGIYESDCIPRFSSDELENLLDVVKTVLVEKQIVGDVDFLKDEQTLRVQVKGCQHIPVEEKMIAKGIEPFTCIPANLIIMAIEDRLNRQVELAEIKIENGVCQLLLVIFDRPARITHE